MKKFLFTASSFSVLGEETSNPYLSVVFRMFSTMKNRNSGVVTEAFIDDIIANAERYVCLPLYADVNKIKCGDLSSLGHNYDPETGKFDTEEIGSFLSFEKLTDEFGVSLMGTARIPKRNATICDAIKFLWANNRLCVSFEIETPDVSYLDDGTYVIDHSEGNKLIGMTVVSVPAYDEAVALTLVAEDNATKEEKKDDQTERNEEVQEDDHHDNDLNEDEADRQIDNEDHDDGDDEVDGEKKMTLEEAMARIAELENQINAGTQDVANKVAELEAYQNEVAQKTAEIESLQTQIAELTPYKEKVEAAEAEAARVALENKINELKTYASAHGLNVEDETIAQAINDMNYEFVVAEMMKAEAAQKEADEAAHKNAEAEQKDDESKDDDSFTMYYASMTVGDTNGLYDRV